jgi:hypothetical protein
VKGAFPREIPGECRQLLWAATGCDEHEPTTWTKPVFRIDGRGDAPFAAAVNTERLHAAFDRLAGRDGWVPRNGTGTFPNRFPVREHRTTTAGTLRALVRTAFVRAPHFGALVPRPATLPGRAAPLPRSDGSEPLLGLNDPLFAVQEFSHDIEMAGVTCGLLNDVENDFSKGFESPIAEVLSGPPPWFGVERNGANDLICRCGGVQVLLEDRGTGHTCAHAPGIITPVKLIDRTSIACRHRQKPESFDIQCQVLDESERRPARRDQRPPQVDFLELIDNSHDMVALSIKARDKHRGLCLRGWWHCGYSWRLGSAVAGVDS